VNYTSGIQPVAREDMLGVRKIKIYIHICMYVYKTSSVISLTGQNHID
jgi:hypothetical protein